MENESVSITGLPNSLNPIRALRSKTANHLQRPSIDEKRSTDELALLSKVRRRVPKSTATTRGAVNRANNNELWDVIGTFDVIRGSADIPFHPRGFSFDMFYIDEGEYTYLFADFRFGDLKGLMRLSPFKEKIGAVNPEYPVSMSLFERDCRFSVEKRVGPANKKWLMAYRAQDCGMKKDKLICSEISEKYIFDFDWDTTKYDLPRAIVQITMPYAGDVFVFTAKRFRDFSEGGDRFRLDFQEKRWNDLYNPNWMLYGEKTIPSWSAGIHFNRPIVGTLKSGSQKAYTEVSAMPSSDEVAKQPGQRVSTAGAPDWAWDLTGTWKIDGRLLKMINLETEPDASWTLDIRMSKGPRSQRQMWAKFDFGCQRQGIMRFYPEDGYDKEITEEQFEEQCALKAGQWPGPSPEGQRNWRMKYRAKKPDGRVDKFFDSWQCEVSFRKNEDGKLSLEGVFCYGILMIFKAEKVSDFHTLGEEDGSVQKIWREYAPYP